MVKIELSRGMVALVDREDLDLVQQHRWHAYTHNSRTWYAKTNIRRPDGRQTTVYMHRLILGLTDPAVHVDHANGDGLDNRRANLRACTRNENMWNARKRADNASGFKGVHWRTARGKWQARIKVYGKRRSLGLFTTAAEAHAAYCRAADELHGDFANYGS